MPFSRDTASSRPLRHEHGPYTVVGAAEHVDGELEGTGMPSGVEVQSPVDSTEAPNVVAQADLGETAVAQTVLTPLTTGYAVKHGKHEGRSVLL